MDSNVNRITRFLENGQILNASDKNVPDKRRTRFPVGTDIQKLHLPKKEKQRILDPNKIEKPTQFSHQASMNVNHPDEVSNQPATGIELSEISPIRIESPWNEYISLRRLERGGQVTVAYTRKYPVRIVVIKEILSDNTMELRKRQHKNLLAIFELYQFQDRIFVSTDYTAATLKQVIAIPLLLEELHVSATCRQVFEGMLHLSRFGIAHRKLDSSKVLFLPDGHVKLAHFDECQSTESAAARSLGVIAIEMMQNGIPPKADGKFVLEHPERWSPEASNFLEVVSWAKLEEVRKHRFLTDVSPTVMIPFILYAGWDTVERFNMQTSESTSHQALL